MLERVLRIIGMAIVAGISGVITGYLLILPLAEELISDPFYAGVISGAAGFLIWYLFLNFGLLLIERK